MADFYAGIDPGFVRTGLVLLDNERNPLKWATFKAHGDGPDFARAVDLTCAINDTIIEWVEYFEVESLRIGIETPILAFKKTKHSTVFNAKTYLKQCRLLEELEHAVWNILPNFCPNVELVEVGPTHSKLMLTGNGAAGKAEVIAAGPFNKNIIPGREDLEAVADAFAHASAASRMRKDVILLHELQVQEVEAFNEGDYDA